MCTLKILEIIDLLFCPDDNSSIILNDNELICATCKRKFSVKENIIDMRPKNKININYDDKKIVYSDYYESVLKDGNGAQFGLSSKSVPEGFIVETFNQLELHLKPNSIVCDIGAATGDYSVLLAKKCKLMIHCDLDLNGLLVAQKKAIQEKVNNILFFRCDYFQIPFRNETIDLAYSIDVVERGIDHDQKILKEISRIIKLKGTLIFDYHTKERTKLTRVHQIALSVYSHNEIKNLIDKLPFLKSNFIGTGYLPLLRNWSNFEYSICNQLSKFLKFPPARELVICLTKSF
jgi:SAM-dependent methyltransferase